MLIIIAGALATGKTTISQEVAKCLNGEYISVDLILADHKLDQFPWGTYSIPLDNFITANGIMKPIIKNALEAKKPVVIDGCFYSREALDDLLQAMPPPHLIFTLRAPMEICIERDRLRPRPLGEETARAVHYLTSKLTLGEVLDATAPVEENVRKIVAAATGS